MMFAQMYGARFPEKDAGGHARHGAQEGSRFTNGIDLFVEFMERGKLAGRAEPDAVSRTGSRAGSRTGSHPGQHATGPAMSQVTGTEAAAAGGGNAHSGVFSLLDS